jgi:hypothetical protein
MIINKKLSKQRLDREIKLVIKKMMNILDYHAKEKGKSFDDICTDTGINPNLFLEEQLPTLTQFLKICFALDIPPHSIIQRAYSNHEINLK